MIVIFLQLSLEKNQFSLWFNDRGEHIIIKFLDSFSFEALKPFEGQSRKIPRRFYKHLQFRMILKSPIMMDLSKKKTPQDNSSFFLHSVLKKNAYTSEIFNDPENENLLLQTIPETYSSVIKQSLNNSFLEPSFFKYASKFNESFLPSDTPLNNGTKTEISSSRSLSQNRI